MRVAGRLELAVPRWLFVKTFYGCEAKSTKSGSFRSQLQKCFTDRPRTGQTGSGRYEAALEGPYLGEGGRMDISARPVPATNRCSETV